MNTAIKKRILLSLIVFGQAEMAMAFDSGSKALGNQVGATDYYQITCASGANGNTDHLNFKITDNSVSSTPVSDPQWLNVHVAKGGLSADAMAVTAGTTRNLSIHGGNGRYSISMDTRGTNQGIKTPQSYQFQFQCLNASGQKTTSSLAAKAGKLRNNQAARFAVNCSKNRTTGNTDSLYISIANTTIPAPGTVSQQVLMAQVTKGLAALNTTQANGAINAKDGNAANGNGDYFITIDSTGTDPSQNNAKLYSFQYSCQNAANVDTGEPKLLQLQDQ